MKAKVVSKYLCRTMTVNDCLFPTGKRVLELLCLRDGGIHFDRFLSFQGQVTTVALSFLRNFGLSFSGASGVLGALSAGVGSLAGDNNRERQQERREREITGVGSMVTEGGQSIAGGFKRGFTGLISKPVQGARQSGVGGTRLSCLFWRIRNRTTRANMMS